MMMLVCAAAMPAHAALHEIRVIGVGIDSLRSGAEAKAVDYAKKRALYMLARKLGAQQVEAQLTKLSEAEIKEMIRGYTVVRTQRKDDVTYAEIKVSIVDTPLRKVLGLPEENPEPQFRRRGVMVLGVYMDGERPLLWEKRNPLTETLKSQSLKMGKGSVIIPVGDPEDLRVVDYNNILTIEYDEMKSLFERYGANEVMIAVVRTGLKGTTDPTDILLRRLTDRGVKLERVSLTPKDKEQEESSRVQDAVNTIAQIATDLAASISIEERKMMEQAAQLPVTFSFITMKEYGDMQAALRSYPGFIQLEVPSVTLQHVDGRLYYDGNERRLRKHLEKSAIFVRPNAEGWTISLRQL
ncbi:MAG: DUF2066 domain-containing protein [Alphaproteobacteria bacterium]|nr:DUF2066 domain-containing protein [Alphaproteobacteria bacterium]